jgi:ergothioneine biosynthesis protein EgtB
MQTLGLPIPPMLSRSDPRRLTGHALADALRGSRTCTLARVLDLTDAQWAVSPQPGVNPFAWELAHIAWFAEHWILQAPSHPLFDSSRLAHDDRWRVPLPSRAEVLAALERQLDACLAALPSGDDDGAAYFHRLALFHEDMHGEAFAWMRAALGYPAPPGAALRPFAPRDPVRIEGGDVALGISRAAPGFAFDNERPGTTVRVGTFEIDATPVTAGEFLRFVMDDGYAQPAWWPGEAGAWRASVDRSHPARWRRRAGTGWECRWFDRWEPLDPARPVIHVNAWEAQAWCLWAGRRLPRAAEWEHAADRIDWGRSVWEWTADAFEPYPGFQPGPYRDYSAPWFGNHRELRGGAVATAERLHDRRYRNFFTPERCDVFAGFRTAA